MIAMFQNSACDITVMCCDKVSHNSNIDHTIPNPGPLKKGNKTRTSKH